MGFPLPWPHGYTPSSTTVEGTALEYDPRVLERGRARLLQQFKGKPRMEALLGVCLGPFQEIEIAAWQLLVERTIDTATWDALRVLARKVGLRGYDSRQDAALRRLARAWILVLRSSGTSEDLIRVARAFTGSTAIELRPYHPASIVVRVLELLDGAEAWLLGWLLRRAATGGVRLTFEFITQDLDETFRFSSSLTDDEASDGSGFGDDDETIGGLWAGATDGEL